ncbi:LysM peptidoglycan-binding domain-containing protein [Celeribacter marinus]|uniref:LysM domain protein n=1 Tax=Celeribacter marinus TaxID=1397108 RepID=A0A0P0A8S8_9RHOB|nr:LysM peptidoglycan-binding domain-containing protein [Celeribacter marinus]ALI54404.1 LysM domain protein [Celeribacter marinus]SFK76125.1 Nucleoid-associated protein YgaU, contains BON and LysM domains [Celeribacter marinus]
MSDKSAFQRAAPVAAASVIAIIAAIGVGLWVAAPEAEAPAGGDQARVDQAALAQGEQADAVGDVATAAVAAKAPVSSGDATGQEVTPDAPDMAQNDVARQTPAPTEQTPADLAQTPEVVTQTPLSDQGDDDQTRDESAEDDMQAASAAAPVTDDVDAAVVDNTTPAASQSAVNDLSVSAASVSLDIVRIPPEGITTVAGHAPANTDVVIYVDGVEVSRATTNTRGEFVALFDLMPSDGVRELTVGLVDGDQIVFSDESIVVAPVIAPAPVEATPVDLAQDQDATPSVDTSEAQASPVTAMRDVEAETSVAQAKPQPTVLKASDEGVQVLQQAGTDATSVRVDALTYDPQGRVFASGRAPSEAQIRLYLNNALAAEAVAGADGQWRVELKDVAAGVYTLRADHVGQDGVVITRAETPFKREDVAILAQIASQAERDGEAVAAQQNAADEPQVEPSEAQRAEQVTDAPTDAQDAALQSPRARIGSVTVQPGNTLWGIASDRYGDGFLYARVFDANKTQIRDPDLIYPGQVFVLPK